MENRNIPGGGFRVRALLITLQNTAFPFSVICHPSFAHSLFPARFLKSVSQDPQTEAPFVSLNEDEFSTTSTNSHFSFFPVTTSPPWSSLCFFYHHLLWYFSIFLILLFNLFVRHLWLCHHIMSRWLWKYSLWRFCDTNHDCFHVRRNQDLISKHFTANTAKNTIFMPHISAAWGISTLRLQTSVLYFNTTTWFKEHKLHQHCWFKMLENCATVIILDNIAICNSNE